MGGPSCPRPGAARCRSPTTSGPAGAGPVKLEFDWKIVPTYNIIARLAGARAADQWVSRGNHHDAWVNGAEIRSAAWSRSWKRRARSASSPKGRWGNRAGRSSTAPGTAEEQGLLGLRPSGGRPRGQLKEHVVAYINSGTTAADSLRRMGPHCAARKLVNQVARDVIDPQKKITGASVAGAADPGHPEVRKEARERADLRIGALGSGSDYTVVPRPPGDRVARRPLRRRGRRRLVSLDLDAVRPLQCVRRSRVRATASRSSRRRAGSC
jgi:N-acetylated-alpha-linked acidic dipeptidase